MTSIAEKIGTFECAHCECDADLNTGREVSNGNRVCDSCSGDFVVCTQCHSEVHKSDTSEAEGNLAICGRCENRYYVYSSLQQCCVLASESVTLRDTNDVVSIAWAETNAYCSDDDDWYADEESIPSGRLYEYGENVLNHCQFDREALNSGTLMFGVELEMEPTDAVGQSQVVEALGGRTCDRYILKSDASLDSGVELVTIPLTLEGHRNDFRWPDVLEPVRGIAKSGAGTENCGMHVHVNKAALSSLQIGKMLVFLNSPATHDHITTIAQRESNTYCKRSHKKVTDGCRCSERRYDVVNVGERTVEIRMFRGNLRAQRVLKNIEFCHALVTYCRDASMQAIEHWAEFASWLLIRRSQYPNLINFLSERQVPFFAGVRRHRKDQSQEAPSCA